MNGIKVEEMAMRIGVSVQTLNRWYRSKRHNPSNEFLQELPAYNVQKTSSGIVRVWTPDDVWKLLEFKSHIKLGRTGKMGKYNGTGTCKSREDKT